MNNIISLNDIKVKDTVYPKIKKYSKDKSFEDSVTLLYNIAKEQCKDVQYLCVCYQDSLIINLKYDTDSSSLFIDDLDILQLGTSNETGCINDYNDF